MGSIWTGSKVKIPVILTNRNKSRVAVLINFDELGIARGGLLEEAINEMVLPAYRPKVDQFVSWCHSIDQDVLRIVLSTPSANLTQDAIIALFFHAARIKKHRYGFYFIRHLHLSLADGTLISDIPYDALTKNKKCTDTSAIGKKLGILNPDAVLEAIKEADAPDNESARLVLEEAMREQSQMVEDACWSIVKAYLETRDHHTNLLEKPAPIFLSGQAIYDLLKDLNVDNNLSDAHIAEARLSATLHLIQETGLFCYVDSDQLVLSTSYSGAFKSYLASRGFSVLDRKTPIYRPRWFPNFAIHKDRMSGYQCLFMRWYIPKVVMTAMEVLVTLWTGWNSGTVLSLTRRNLIITAQHIVIDGIKTKTGYNFRTSVKRQSQPRFYQVLAALAAHAENVENHWVFVGEKLSLFATYSQRFGGDLRFQVTCTSLIKSHICVPMGIKAFTPKQLRDQAANLLYLSSLDPFKVKDFLGHANLSSTHAYLNQHVIRLLNEGNVNRFIDKLSATITWATRGEKEVVARGMLSSDISCKLLFPVGEAPSDMPSIADDWIDAKGDLEICIGMAEVEHLRFQIRYYKENKDKLHSDNPKGFLLYHVPRILFAAALAERVRQHPVYGSLLNNNDYFSA